MSLDSAGQPRAAQPNRGQNRAGLSACPLRRGELLFSPQTTPMSPCRIAVAAPGPPRGGAPPRPARPPPPAERTRPEPRPQPTPPPQPPTPPTAQDGRAARLRRSRRRSAHDGRGPGRPSRPPPPVRADTHTHRRPVLRPRPADPPACFVPPVREKPPPTHHRQATADSGQDRRQPQQPKQRPATPTGSRSNRGLGRSRDDEGGAPR